MFTRKPTTSSAPVILLKYNVELITGMRLVNLLKFCFSFCPDFIIKGTVDKIIKQKTGIISKMTAIIVIP